MIHKSIFIFLVLFLFILLGCEKSVDNSGTGILSIKLMDAPFPINMVSEANVTIYKVEVRRDQDDSQDNPFLILSEDDTTYNLLDLQNGVTADLAEIEVPVGDYNLVRLYVSSANIKLNDETVYDLKVPSGDQTGIKIFVEPSIRIVGGLTTELLLDFDVSQSFVVQGNPFTPAGIKGFHFKPVIRAANVSTTGSIFGKVIDNASDVLADANVWIEDNGNTYSAFTGLDGLYKVSLIPQGIYTVKATKKTVDVEYDTVSVENVEVVAGNVIHLDDFMLTKQ